MSSRYHRLDKILEYRISRERLCQRRAAICRRWLQIAQQRLDNLRHACQKVRTAPPPAQIARVAWYQYQQQYLRAAQERIARVERLRRMLRERLQRRQFQLKKAAQRRRATETALERIEQEVNQALAQNKDRELDELTRLKLLEHRSHRDAIATRGRIPTGTVPYC